MPRGLIVDDDPMLAALIARQLAEHGIEGSIVESLGDARRELEAGTFDVVIADVSLRDGRGHHVVEGLDPAARPPLIVMTDEATIELAVDALRLGAIDFLLKPFSPGAMNAALARVTGDGRASPPALVGAGSAWRNRYAPDFIGEHPSVLSIFDKLARVSDTDSPILFYGETGTGKELLTAAVHAASSRRSMPFVALNCAAIPETLIESDLFGHSRGAFTGALSARVGRFLAANHGTLFLDEIGEMPIGLQAKLLRALQEKEITPVGESFPVDVDVRIIAASHQNLDEAVSARRFRADLLYRLDVLHFRLPSLRERASDIPLLVRRLTKRIAARTRRQPPQVAQGAIDRLVAYSWPGNVRQLQNVLERMLLLAEGDVLLETDVPDFVAARSRSGLPPPPPRAAPSPILRPPDLPEEGIDLRSAVESYEQSLIAQALARTGGNKKRAAALLRTSRTTLLAKLRKHGPKA